MSFWDNVKKFAQPYADEEYDEYDDEMEEFEEEEVAPARPARRVPAFGASAPASAVTSFNAAPAASATAAAPAASVTSTPSSGFSGQVLNMHGAGKQEVVLFHAKAFDDAAKAADELRSRRAVILNMENVDKALTRRVVDFLSGCVYALDGKVKKIAQCTYLFCPHSMDIVGDLEAIKVEAESYV